MLGAIIGDLAGSTYEVKEIIEKNKKHKVSVVERRQVLDRNVSLFPYLSSVTDDSILTVAIADAYLNDKDYGDTLREYGLREVNNGVDSYGRSRFGRGFVKWLHDSTMNNSYGNGCAMRISSLPVLIDDIDELKKEVYKATVPTHNHEESLLCAEALSVAIFMAKNSSSKEEIKSYIENNYFSLDFNLEELQENYEFTSKAINSVPQAIYIFLESSDFEDSIRKAISIGGDADTIACMVGAIAEQYYGIPDDIKENIKDYIPDYMNDIIKQFYERKKDKNGCKKISRRINKK